MVMTASAGNGQSEKGFAGYVDLFIDDVVEHFYFVLLGD